MNDVIDGIKEELEAINLRIHEEAAALHERLKMLDEKVDPALEAVKSSRFTPIWLAILAAAWFCAGIWVGRAF